MKSFVQLCRGFVLVIRDVDGCLNLSVFNVYLVPGACEYSNSGPTEHLSAVNYRYGHAVFDCYNITSFVRLVSCVEMPIARIVADLCHILLPGNVLVLKISWELEAVMHWYKPYIRFFLSVYVTREKN